jgi:hypothetical protein
VESVKVKVEGKGGLEEKLKRRARELGLIISV